MKIFHFTCIALMFAVVPAQYALAYSLDDKSMNGSNAPAFNDPDDKTPLYMQNGDKPAAGSEDPSSIRYDYDPASGNYIPHRMSDK